MTGTTWLEEITGQLRGMADAVVDEIRANGLMPLLAPVAPFDRPAVLAPAVALGGLLSLALLSGTAVAALGGLLLSLLALYVLLVDVFGISVELTPIGPR
jgi:hypothetical protein